MTNWRVQGSKIYYKDQETRIRGTNLYGNEINQLCLLGLDHYSMYDLIHNVKKLGFNAIRVPFALETVWRFNEHPPQEKIKNPQDKNKSVKQLMLDMTWIMPDAQMIMMIDMHRLRIYLPGGQNAITPLWYSNEQGVSTQMVIDGWKQVAEAFKDVPNVLFEIKNEPHSDDRGSATWGSGNLATDWDKAAIQISREIAKIKKDTLFVVQGIQIYEGFNHGWGSNVSPYIKHPLPNDLNYVLSAHIYNIGVIPNMLYDPNNTWRDWQKLVGDVADINKIPILIKETGSPTPGSSYEINDPKVCQNAIDFEFGFAYWVNRKNIAGVVQWCVQAQIRTIMAVFYREIGIFLKQINTKQNHHKKLFQILLGQDFD